MKVEGMAVWYDLTYHMKLLSCSTIGSKKIEIISENI
jgi:hypothetical protein